MKKLCLRLPGRLTYIFWDFDFLIFPTFKQLLTKFFTKKPPGFKKGFESTNKVLPLHQYLWSEISRQWNNVPLNSFWNLHGRAFCFLYFYTSKMWVIPMRMKVSQVGCFQITSRRICYSTFFYISFAVFFTKLLSKSLWRNYPFSAQISKIHFKM